VIEYERPQWRMTVMRDGYIETQLYYWLMKSGTAEKRTPEKQEHPQADWALLLLCRCANDVVEKVETYCWLNADYARHWLRTCPYDREG
jgi:hypothetical protein